MQSRLAISVARSYMALSAAPRQALGLGYASSASSNDNTGPSIHSGEPEETNKVADPKPVKEEKETVKRYGKETEPLMPPKPPRGPTTRLENPGVLNQPAEPYIQQKRSNKTTTAALENVSCIGFDGRPPWKDKEEEDEDMEYYKHHKASPLSEIEVADTRKPITRATDGTAGSGDYGAGETIIGWKPEQLDTAEESLRRATEIWKQNAMRGDPDVFPHSRVLRELRGEWF